MPPQAPARLVVGIVLAQMGIFLAILTPVVVTLALRVDEIVPKGQRGAKLGTVMAVGAVLALVANPLFGALSDRTTSRFGRRRPWLLGGMSVGFAGLAVIAFGDTVSLLTLGWALAQLGCNAALAAVTSTIPDLIPEEQRARVSGFVGMSSALAMILGSLLANVFQDTLALAFLIPAALGLAAVCYLCTVMTDRPAAKGSFPPYGLREFGLSFWVNPRKHPDFSWNFVSRFLVFAGISAVTTYQVYFLEDRLGYSEDEVTGKMFLGTIIMVLMSVAGSVAGGFLSDRVGRRKPFVLGAAILIGVGLLLLAVAHSYALFLIALFFFGIGQGLYMAVDLALAAAVLPDPATSAKDMGVLNVANALPQSLVPIVAPAVLAIGGGNENYTALFLLGGICAALGATAIQFVRAVR
ncbi:MFS transporter [Streptomyces sp. DT20]|uniref:MFS transporter n=1 Tax=unclassified Streptomyces TaxID=2593676 RepID=UPI002E282578|nr:MFS transporter [Streptomyces sp. NBC_00304]WRZ15900.1 MFS transporter [Streptomyces sp. NBC_00341]